MKSKWRSIFKKRVSYYIVLKLVIRWFSSRPALNRTFKSASYTITAGQWDEQQEKEVVFAISQKAPVVCVITL